MEKNRVKTLWALFMIFFKASAFTFAGGLAMLPLIQRAVTDKYQLMSKDDFIEYATLAQSLPGIIAINCACLVGRKTAGFPGMAAAGLGAILPAFVLMLAATVVIGLAPREGMVVGAFRGIRAASAALVLSAAFTMGSKNLKGAFGVVVMLAAFSLMIFAGLSAFFVIILAGLSGYVYSLIRAKRGKA